MRTEGRFEALAIADARLLEELADEILARGADVSVTVGPESVSAPVRVAVAGSEDSTVVLGHVALSRCSVLIDGTRGDGIRVGYDLPGAVAAAVCDAECERDGGLSARVHDLCRAVHESDAQRRSERAELVAMTTLDEP